MQDPASEIKDVVRILLKGSITERLKVIDTCFTADAKFIHPLLTLRGRREIFDLYQYWYDANKNIEFVATKIVVSQQKDRLCLDIDESISPLPLAFLPYQHIRLIVFLDLQKTPSGYKISCQEDHVLWSESILTTFPALSRLWTVYGRRITGLGIVFLMQAAGETIRFVTNKILPNIPYVNENESLKRKVQATNKALDPKLFKKWEATGPQELFEEA